jgi:hypothetical protein
MMHDTGILGLSWWQEALVFLVLIGWLSRRWERINQRIARLEKWRRDVEETPKREAIQEVENAALDLSLHRNHSKNRYFPFADGERPPVSAEDQDRTEELREQLLIRAKHAIDRYCVKAEIILAILQRNDIEPVPELLDFIEKVRNRGGEWAPV